METGKISVLVVVYNRGQTKLLRKYFLDLSESTEVRFVKTSEDAITALQDSERDVIIVEESLPDINGLRFTEFLKQEYSTTQVLLISENKQVDVVLKAIRSGAYDFLSFDIPFNEFTEILQRAGDQAAVERKKLIQDLPETRKETPSQAKSDEHLPGCIVSVYSPKGGVGVSTIAANLALALRAPEHEVSIVDCNLQYGDIAILFNEVPRVSVLALAPRIEYLDSKLIEDVVTLNRQSGIHILAAPTRTDLSETLTGEQLERILIYMKDIYRYTIVNTNSHLDDVTFSALGIADVVVLTLTQEITAIKAARSFLDLWDRSKLNRDRIVIVINQYDVENPLTLKKISDSLKARVSLTIPEDKAMMLKHANLGTPVLLSDSNSTIGRALQSVADAVYLKVLDLKENSMPSVFKL